MKNWKTTLSGIGAAFASLLAIVAVAPYQLGELGDVIPPEHKATIVVISSTAAFMLRVWNSFATKDATPASPVVGSQILK